MKSNRELNKADEKIHKVEDQWHYNTLVDNGWTSLDKEGIGFVRSYRYQKDAEIITVKTGYSADTWSSDKGVSGYWGTLALYLDKSYPI